MLKIPDVKFSDYIFIPKFNRPKFLENLDKLTKMGVIKLVVEITDWAPATDIMLKQNGKVRFCLDPRPLNKEKPLSASSYRRSPA